MEKMDDQDYLIELLDRHLLSMDEEIERLRDRAAYLRKFFNQLKEDREEL